MGARDSLPEMALVRSVQDQRARARELKSYQRLGSKSVLTDRIFSDQVSDIQTPAHFSLHRILIEFTPDDMTFGGVFCHELVAVNNPSGPFPSTEQPERQRVGSDGVQRWILYSYYSSTPYKFYFLTNGSGTFTANII